MTDAQNHPPRTPLADILQGIDGILFDMDGVLLDTENIYTEAAKRVLGPLADQFTWRIKEKMMGRSPLEAATILVRELRPPFSAEEYNERKRPILLELFRACEEKPGASRLVEHLAQVGVPMVVATSSDRKYFEAKTNHHPWFRHFKSVVCGSDARVGRHKPAPDIFLEAAKDLQIPAERCLVFEDSAAGVESARAAKAKRVVAIVDPNLDASLVQTADVIIRSYDELTF